MRNLGTAGSMVEATASMNRPVAAVRRGRVIAALAVAAALIALPLIADASGHPAFTTLATRIVILSIAALSLNFALGYGGMVSFGHAAYYGIGGYAAGIMTQTFAGHDALFGFIPGSDQLLVNLPVAMAAGGLAALALGALSLRTSGVQFIMITLAFAQMLFFFFVALKTYGGDDGLILRRRNTLPAIDTRNDTQFYLLCLALLALWIGFVARVVGSRFGQMLDGIKQNPRRMAAIGIAAYPYQLLAFTISGIGAGLAGGLMANFAKFVSPDMLHWMQSGEFLIMVILGGVGTLLGPAIGATILILLESTLASWTEHWQAIVGPILIIIVLFGRPAIAGLARHTSGRHDD
jgi:branched-chain amino acid transport system permease protein